MSFAAPPADPLFHEFRTFEHDGFQWPVHIPAVFAQLPIPLQVRADLPTLPRDVTVTFDLCATSRQRRTQKDPNRPVTDPRLVTRDIRVSVYPHGFPEIIPAAMFRGGFEALLQVAKPTDRLADTVTTGEVGARARRAAASLLVRGFDGYSRAAVAVLLLRLVYEPMRWGGRAALADDLGITVARLNNLLSEGGSEILKNVNFEG